MPITLDGTAGTLNGAVPSPVLGTAISATSGTAIDFTGIPSWAKRVTVMFNQVSTSGTSNLLVQVGSGSLTTSAYLSSSASGATTVASAAGFVATVSIAAASAVIGHMVLTNITGNVWVSSHTIGANSANITSSGGGATPVLSGALDRIRVTTVNGTDTFDSGFINIMWE